MFKLKIIAFGRPFARKRDPLRESMTDPPAQLEEKRKRKSTALLAVMDENCSSSAGALLCDLHCPVENWFNIP